MYNRLKKKGQLTKEELILLSKRGNFFTDPDFDEFADRDGTEARRYLESKGFEVIEHQAIDGYGWAVTSCGIRLRSDGYIGKVIKEESKTV